MKKVIQVALDEDTANFLAMLHPENNAGSLSDFINSLLRHEQFRRGYTANFADPSVKPITRLQDKMLRRSGLLPLGPVKRHT